MKTWFPAVLAIALAASYAELAAAAPVPISTAVYQAGHTSVAATPVRYQHGHHGYNRAYRPYYRGYGYYGYRPYYGSYYRPYYRPYVYPYVYGYGNPYYSFVTPYAAGYRFPGAGGYYYGGY